MSPLFRHASGFTLLLSLVSHFFLCPTAFGQEASTKTVYEKVAEDLKSELVESELFNSVIVSGSALMVWKDSVDLLALTDRTIEATYAGFPPVELHQEVQRRKASHGGQVNWLLWFDTGLMAMAAERYEDAALCFSESIKDAEIEGNPYPLAYMGRSKLRQNNLEEARQLYSAAIEAASPTPPARLQIRFMYSMDLYDSGNFYDAFEDGGPIEEALASEYPLEQCFALYELLMRSWAENDEATVGQLLPALKDSLKGAGPRDDSSFEHRRYSQALELAQRIESASNGEPLSKMILDEECCDLFFRTGRWEEARDKLKPWVEEFPLTDYSEWDEDLRDAATWTHLNHLLAVCVAGDPESAETGFVAYLQAVPVADFPRKVIEAWCWLGYSHLLQGKLEEAATAFETGLEKDALNSVSIQEGLPIDPLQPRIVGGKMRYQTRKAFVKQYRDALLLLQERGE